MNQYTSLSNYVQKIADRNTVYNIDKDLVVEVVPQRSAFLIEYKDKNISFRFENEKVLLQVEEVSKSEYIREVMPISEVRDYLKSLRLEFLVNFILSKVPFLEK